MLNKNSFTSRDVQAMTGVSTATAAKIIRSLHGEKDAAGRWSVDKREFLAWYNSPTRSTKREGECRMNYEQLVSDIRAFAGSERVTISLYRKKGRPNFFLRILAPGGRQKMIVTGTPNRREAAAIHGEVLARFRRMEEDGIVPYSTRAAFDDWLRFKESAVAPGSYARYRAITDKALPFMPGMMHEVRPHHVERYAEHLTVSGYHPKTIRLELATLSEIFKRAARFGYCKINPTSDVERPKCPKPQVSAYTDAELSAIFAELERRGNVGRYDQCLQAWRTYAEVFYCLYYTGMRVSDAINLTWESVNLRFGVIELSQIKTSRKVFVRIPSPFKARLEALTPATDRAGRVFTSTTGEPVSYTPLDKAIRAVLKACNIEKHSPIHAFRHTTAMRLLGAGVPIHEVAAQLGDTVETVVRNYVKPNMMGQAAVDRAYAPAACPQNVPTIIPRIGVNEPAESMLNGTEKAEKAL